MQINGDKYIYTHWQSDLDKIDQDLFSSLPENVKDNLENLAKAREINIKFCYSNDYETVSTERSSFIWRILANKVSYLSPSISYNRDIDSLIKVIYKTIDKIQHFIRKKIDRLQISQRILNEKNIVLQIYRYTNLGLLGGAEISRQEDEIKKDEILMNQQIIQFNQISNLLSRNLYAARFGLEELKKRCMKSEATEIEKSEYTINIIAEKLELALDELKSKNINEIDIKEIEEIFKYELDIFNNLSEINYLPNNLYYATTTKMHDLSQSLYEKASPGINYISDLYNRVKSGCQD